MTAEKEEVKTIWDKIGALDYRIIYTIVALLVAIPVWAPIGIPMEVGKNVKDYAEAIYALEPGAVVLCKFSGYATMLPDVEPIYLATWKMLLERDCYFYVMLGHADSPSIIRMEFEKLKPWIEEYGKEYGKDFVVFQYISYTTAAEISFAKEGWWTMYTVDMYDTRLDEIPVMEHFNNGWDIDLLISGGPEYNVGLYYVRFETPIICWGTGTGLLPFVAPFYPERVLGYCGSATQGGELELYSGYLGEGIKYNDAKNIAVVGLVIFVIIGNIAYFGKKFSGR